MEDLVDGVGLRRCNAVVDGLSCDDFPNNLALGNLGAISGLKWRACALPIILAFYVDEGQVQVTLTRSVAGLQDVQGSPHVALAQLDEGIHGLGYYLDALFFDYLVDEHSDVLLLEGAEAEARTP